MSGNSLLLEKSDGVALVTLNRPDAANGIDLALARALMEAAIDCDEDPAVRAVVLTGAGKMFCAGGDLKSFAGFGDALPARLKELTTYLHAATSRFARMDAPLLCAVNGTAAGAGFSLAISGDLVLVAESAKLTLAYTGVGLSPDGSSSYFLPRLVGLRRAQELMLTNRRLSAAEALDWGLATEVVPDAELAGRAGALARQLAAGPTRAFGTVKQLLDTAPEAWARAARCPRASPPAPRCGTEDRVRPQRSVSGASWAMKSASRCSWPTKGSARPAERRTCHKRRASRW